MSNVINVAAVPIRTVPFDARAARVAKAATPGTPSNANAAATVGATMSQVTYTASLDTLRTANKMMMGYLLNIKV